MHPTQATYSTAPYLIGLLCDERYQRMIADALLRVLGVTPPSYPPPLADPAVAPPEDSGVPHVLYSWIQQRCDDGTLVWWAKHWGFGNLIGELKLLASTPNGASISKPLLTMKSMPRLFIAMGWLFVMMVHNTRSALCIVTPILTQ